MNKIKNITKIKTFLQKQNAGHKKKKKKKKKNFNVSRVNENTVIAQKK